MQPFKFIEGGDAQGAILHFSGNSEYLAGGTTLIDLMKLQVMTPSQLVDLGSLPLKKIQDDGERINVDALVTNNEMAHHPLIKKNFPLVSEALLSGASVQLRNLATTAGNILQKTRCSYYRDLHARCNKRNPGSGCDALDGFNRMHAIVGVSDHCIASHPSDLCVALLAAGAVIHTQRNSGNREIPIEQFFTLPAETPQIENVLEPGELILSVSLPKTPWFRHSTYVKIRDRSSYAFALTSAAVALEMHGNTVKQARIAMGGVGTIPWRVVAAEKVLEGHGLGEVKMKEAAQAILKDAQVKKFNAFKVELAQQTLIRALTEASAKS